MTEFPYVSFLWLCQIQALRLASPGFDSMAIPKRFFAGDNQASELFSCLGSFNVHDPRSSTSEEDDGRLFLLRGWVDVAMHLAGWKGKEFSRADFYNLTPA